jgi:hypothetical protein
MNRFSLLLIAAILASQAVAQEVTLQNDSLTERGHVTNRHDA